MAKRLRLPIPTALCRILPGFVTNAGILPGSCLTRNVPAKPFLVAWTAKPSLRVFWTLYSNAWPCQRQPENHMNEPTVTPELVQKHSLTPEEFDRICELL